MAKKPKPAPARASSVPPGREAPGVDLSAAVAIEHANKAVNAPVPPPVQAVLDADPRATAAAREARDALLAAASPVPPPADGDEGEEGQTDPQTPPASDQAAGNKE